MNNLNGPKPELNISLNEYTQDKVSIIIVHKDKPQYLNLTLQSIAICSINHNYEIIVVDNGSDEQTQAYLDEIQEDIKVIRNKENLYWSEAANIGAAAASKDSKYLLFMHSDVVVLSSAWLEIMINVFETRNTGLVGVEFQSYYIDRQKIDFLSEWLLMFSRDCWQACGPWDTRLRQVGHSFIMTLKANDLGYVPQKINNLLAYHYKILGMDISLYEKFVLEAQVEIPKIRKENYINYKK